MNPVLYTITIWYETTRTKIQKGMLGKMYWCESSRHTGGTPNIQMEYQVTVWWYSVWNTILFVLMSSPVGLMQDKYGKIS